MVQSAIFDTSVIKVKSLESKFDTTVLSNSFVALIGDYIEARILQQLHYWCYSEYGVVIDGIRWIYKPIREWLCEAFIGFTSWQLRKAIASLEKKGILLKKHLFKEHHGNNFAPKNRTYYYSLNYKKLEQLINECESAVTTENVRFVNSTNQFCENSEKQFCDYAKNNTKNTSIENITKDKSHPTLPCVCEEIKTNSQEEKPDSNPELPTSQAERNKASYKAIDRDNISEDVEQNINQDISTNKRIVREDVQERGTVQEDVQVASETKSIVKPKLKTSKGTKPKRKNKAPWKDEGQFKRFYRALIQALPIVANAHSPQGLAQTIIRQLRSGIPHSYWDDFIAGLPIGTSTKPEWEIEPGVPYPMFIEYLTEKIRKGDNTTTNEQTRNEVFRILDKPRQAKAFWGQFKRSVVNVSEQVERDRALGVSNPHTPVWTRERIEPTISEAEEAGQKIMAVNHDARRKIEAANKPQLESIKTLPRQLSERTYQASGETPDGLSSSLTPDPWIDEKCEKSPPTLSELLTKRLGDRHLKSLTKQMPKVSQAEAIAEAKAEIETIRKQKLAKKTHINQMSILEINELLTDPIVRKELTSQIILNNKFDVVTDNLGEILSVKINREYSKNKEKY